MGLTASFESDIIKTAHFFTLRNMFNDTYIRLLFDTGATFSVIGINNILDSLDESTHDAFKQILYDEITKQGISKRGYPLRTATGKALDVYPCVLHDALIGSATPFEFYFELTESHLEEPILGRSYSDDCAYSHSIQGKIRINGIADKPGYRLYASVNVLDFTSVMARYYKEK